MSDIFRIHPWASSEMTLRFRGVTYRLKLRFNRHNDIAHVGIDCDDPEALSTAIEAARWITDHLTMGWNPADMRHDLAISQKRLYPVLGFEGVDLASNVYDLVLQILPLATPPAEKAPILAPANYVPVGKHFGGLTLVHTDH